MQSQRHIVLRGVRVHNLKGVDLDIPRRRLVVLCGKSGSGKSSLAFDTLYAEGQRRYIESFSAYTRQFLERLEKPAADRIEGIPPAVAVSHRQAARSNRSTVGTATETTDYLRLLFAKIGRVYCRQCGRPVERHSPESVAAILQALPSKTRFLVAFPADAGDGENVAQVAARMREAGFARGIVDGQARELMELVDGGAVGILANSATALEVVDGGAVGSLASSAAALEVVVDRLASGGAMERIRDSLETAFAHGNGSVAIYVDSPVGQAASAVGQAASLPSTAERASVTWQAGSLPYERTAFSRRFRCHACQLDYLPPEPRLFSFNSPLGACPACEGFGNVLEIDMDLVVPDRQKTLREGAIAPWNTPAYAHELEELLALAGDYGLPVDVPFRELDEEHLRLVQQGVPERKFGGLDGFFAWLASRKYKMHIRAFLNRWRSDRPCPACGGRRLRPEALDARVGGLNIAEVCELKVRDAAEFFRSIELNEHERVVARVMLEQISSRLDYLHSVGLDYLTLDRSLRTISGGEAHRVGLTTALGSSLVNMLYVLDEPTAGLHPHDTDRVIGVLRRLRDRGNSVVVVEHDEAVLRSADQVIEIGPGAGESGGKVVFQGTAAEMENAPGSLTGDYLAGRRGVLSASPRRRAGRGSIRLVGARGHNLKNLTVEFPLGVLCIVTGVSGSGKSSLVQQTLYPALLRRLQGRRRSPESETSIASLPYDDVFGDGQLEDVVLVDQSPVGRSPRSNPVTYIKAFDDIRAVFAESLEARTHNYTVSHFSFNSAEGRCETCQGDGCLEIDMQFLADVYMTCPDCHGTRYRPEILRATHRGLNIAQVLELTIREAFGFFRGRTRLQARLKRLMDVGLDYLRLGQPANTLSGGEAQRLKLAGYLATARRARTLFVLDEPTTGLHFSDIVQLQDCFEALLGAGHSLIVVEHNLQLIRGADHLIDLGPGAADDGGRLVAQGTPEEVAASPDSLTGRYLTGS